MRKKQSNTKTVPYLRGLAAGYLLTFAASAAGALIMLIAGTDSGMAWLPALIAGAAGSFLCGRTAGKFRRRDGLRTGALCGILYLAPLLVLSLIFGRAGGVMLPVRVLLCLGFAAAGGVAGVNSPEK